jgi:ParB family transcriptional regulator, chromosome partitioning protein
MTNRKRTSLNLDLLKERAASDFVPDDTDSHKDEAQTFVPLVSILDRFSDDARPINQRHVEALRESISVLGLISPLTVDNKFRLLAGGHRRVALQLLAESEPKQFAQLFPDGIPVRVMDIDSAADAVSALQIEVEENTQRKNFTPAEIKEAATRLEAAGYQRLKGRPRKDQKSLKRELASVFRLSEDRIQKILNDSTSKGRRTPTFSAHSAIITLEAWLDNMEQSVSPEREKVSKHMKTLIQALEKMQESS